MDTYIKRLEMENAVLKAEIIALKAEKAALKEVIASFKKVIETLRAEQIAFKETIKKLEARVAELERRLNLNSQTSSKPPSTDGFHKPISLRSSGQHPSGGQKGHPGTTLKMRDTPDKVERYQVDRCAACQQDLSHTMPQTIHKAQVFDVPEPKLMCTEYHTEEKVCSCGHINKSHLPEGVNYGTQYGAHVCAIAVYLSVQQLIPEDRLAETMQDLLGVELCAATVAKYVAEAAEKLKPFEAETQQIIDEAPVKHKDETGFSICAKLGWLHVASTETHTYYKPTQKRGDIIPSAHGVNVHDGFKSYNTLENVQHALCNAHHLRELEALIQYEKEPWAKAMQTLLKFACHTAKRLSVARFQEPIVRRYDQIVEAGLRYHQMKPPLVSKRGKKRAGHNLLIRLRDYKNAVLRFLYDPLVPFTNNRAEQDLRMMKVKQKISGGFRSLDGAIYFCRIRGFFSTLHKQKRHVFAELANLYLPLPT